MWLTFFGTGKYTIHPVHDSLHSHLRYQALLCKKWKSLAALGRDFSKRLWESALFADSHGRDIFHQAICHVVCYPQIVLKNRLQAA